jgi:hypothetical protein
MPGLVPGIHVFAPTSKKDVDGRDKPGHDEIRSAISHVHNKTGGTLSCSAEIYPMLVISSEIYSLLAITP